MYVSTSKSEADLAFEQHCRAVVLTARLTITGIERAKAPQATEPIEGSDRCKKVIGFNGSELLLVRLHRSACPPCIGGH
jgi:hypothetical protein